MKRRHLLAFLVLSALASCTHYPEGTTPQEVTFKPHFDSSKHVIGYRDLVIKPYNFAEREGFATASNVASASLSPSNAQNMRRVELAGLRCVGESDEFRVAITSPGTMRLPLYNKRPSDVRIVCSGNGYEGSIEIPALLDGLAVISNHPGVLLLTLITVSAAVANNVWSYSGADGNVILIRAEKTAS